MLFEEGLYTFLSTTPALTAIIGLRIYPIVAPQNVVLPACVYRVTGKSEDVLLDEEGLRTHFVELQAWGEDYGAIKTLAQLLRTALLAAPPDLGGYPIETCVWRNETDEYDPEAKGGAGLMGVIMSFEIVAPTD